MPSQRTTRHRRTARTPLAERFASKIAKTESCWLWTAYRQPSGYGMIGLGGKHGGMDLAHRVAWTLAYGPIPPGMFVLHHCDNPPCVRHDHLFLGDAAANARDAASKNRMGPQVHADSYSGDNHWTVKSPEKIKYGVDCGRRTKLSDSAVAEIRHDHASGAMSQTDLATKHGVSRTQIRRIILGLSRRNII